jgi:hypothetical protein
LCYGSTPIFTGDGEGGSGFAAAAAAASAGGVSGYDFGVDPNLDPELALALRVSMEEERARQEAAAKKAAEDASKQEKGGEQQAISQDATMTERTSTEAETNDMMVSVISYLSHVHCLFCPMLCFDNNRLILTLTTIKTRALIMGSHSQSVFMKVLHPIIILGEVVFSVSSPAYILGAFTHDLQYTDKIFICRG